MCLPSVSFKSLGHLQVIPMLRFCSCAIIEKTLRKR